MENHLLELSNSELRLLSQVRLLSGSMEQKFALLWNNGMFTEYKNIHAEYCSLAQAAKSEAVRNEALKRAVFLGWHYMIEPACFSGIAELEPALVRASYALVNLDILEHRLDREFAWMLGHYAFWDWAIQAFASDCEALMSFLSNVVSSQERLPATPELLAPLDNRGQMGAYFTSIIAFRKSQPDRPGNFA